MMELLFRGTSAGFKGNPVLQNQSLTPTSKSPFVAYLFAKESSYYGQAVVLIFDKSQFKGRIHPSNVFQKEEEEIVLRVSPFNAFGQCIKEVRLRDFETMINRLGIRIDNFAEERGNRKIKRNVYTELIEVLMQ